MLITEGGVRAPSAPPLDPPVRSSSLCSIMLETEKYWSIKRIAIAERASLEEVDRPSLSSVIVISVTRGPRRRQRHRKTRFSFGSSLPCVSANPYALPGTFE